MANISAKDMEAEARRRQAELEAQKIKDPRRERQRQLFTQIHHKWVHDIVGPFPDANGDSVIVTVFASDHRRDFKDGEKAVIMIICNEPHSQRVVFEEVTIRQNRYFLPNGDLLVKVLADATFDY